MNLTIVKQVAGIDVAQDELVISLGQLNQDLSIKTLGYKTFKNNAEGFLKFDEWTHQLIDPSVPLQFVMEATGVYHESLAYFLSDRNYSVSVVLPNKISNYVRTLDTKTVTDKTASAAIMQFGLQRQLTLWKAASPEYRQLRQLTRERDQVMQLKTMAKNQVHAELAEARPHKDSVARTKSRIKFFEKQLEQISASIVALINTNAELKRRIKQSCTIPGVGTLTAAIVLAETNGFSLIKNKKQLSSYAGLDVQEKQSGTSVHGKARISKRGNKNLRKSLHMPALAAIKSDERSKAVFARLVSRHGIKMKAAVAVQRKLLEMIYTLYKKDEDYDGDYYKKLESSELLPKQAG